MCMILFYLPNFNGGWLVGWLGSVVKVVESAVIWLLTGFVWGSGGLREREKKHLISFNGNVLRLRTWFYQFEF